MGRWRLQGKGGRYGPRYIGHYLRTTIVIAEKWMEPVLAGR